MKCTYLLMVHMVFICTHTEGTRGEGERERGERSDRYAERKRASGWMPRIVKNPRFCMHFAL